MLHKKRILAVLMAAVSVLSILFVPLQARADSVTDTLSVCVGYSGMDLTDYVTVQTYHWSELEQELPIYEQAYSYFSSGTWDNEYTAIVDSARGFLISDLLSYANIYYGDIYNILFYVVDAQGIWTAFDRDSLFGTRYYFNDLAGHRTIIYGTKEQQVEDGDQVTTETVPDYTKIEGYTFDQAWDDCEVVEPMLSLEDNWASFSEEFEHIGSDFSYMSTGSRFRLLFGQTSPTESMTRESAKYVSRVYITLNGSPSIGEMPEEIDGSLGSHEVTVPITDVYNKDMTNALSEYLNLESTNENVLRIDNIEIEATEYSDVANVKISYSIIGEGEASIKASVGSQELTNSNGATMSQLTTVQGGSGGDGSGSDGNGSQEGGTGNEEEDNKNGGSGSEGGSGQEDGTTNPTDTTTPTTTDKNPSKSGSDKESSSGQATGQGTSSDDTQNGENDSQGSVGLSEGETSEKVETQDDSKEVVEADAGESLETKSLSDTSQQTLAYALTGDAMQQLAQLQETVTTDVKAEQSITEVTVDEEDDDEELLIFLGLGILGIILCGGITEYISFRVRLKRGYVYVQKKETSKS